MVLEEYNGFILNYIKLYDNVICLNNQRRDDLNV